MTGVDLLNPSEAAPQGQLPLFTFISDKPSDIDASVNRNKNFAQVCIKKKVQSNIW